MVIATTRMVAMIVEMAVLRLVRSESFIDGLVAASI